MYHVIKYLKNELGCIKNLNKESNKDEYDLSKFIKNKKILKTSRKIKSISF